MRAVAVVTLALVVAGCSASPSPSPTDSPSPSPTISPTPLESPSDLVIDIKITCHLGHSCERETQAVMDAVDSVGGVPISIDLEPGVICLANPFDPTSCPFALPPGATDFIGSAVVEFFGIPETAYLNLFAAEDGSILHQMTLFASVTERG